MNIRLTDPYIARLLRIAKVHLNEMPGAYDEFENEALHGCGTWLNVDVCMISQSMEPAHKCDSKLTNLIDRWSRGYTSIAAAPTAPAQPQAAPEPAPVVEATAWTLTKPKRYQGYTEPLYQVLEAAHIAGKSVPTARDILQAWATNHHAQIAKVIEGESLDYYLADGTTKTANLRAIAAAIKGMTRKSQN